jgi:hypothetical protein
VCNVAGGKMSNAVLTKEITLKNRLGVAIIVFLGGTTFVSIVLPKRSSKDSPASKYEQSSLAWN